MGLLDTLRDKLRRDDDYYEDDYYDEGEEASYDRGSRQTGRTKLLGNSSRPEAESVSVYTRSGRPLEARPVANDFGETASARSYQRYEAERPTAYDPMQDVPTPGDAGHRAGARVTSGQLPPYVLRPVSYDDVQSVVRRVRTNQPVILVFKTTNIEVAKRILDFSFGLSYGLDGSVEELGDRVFVVLPKGICLGQADLDKLRSDGDLER